MTKVKYAQLSDCEKVKYLERSFELLKDDLLSHSIASGQAYSEIHHNVFRLLIYHFNYKFEQILRKPKKPTIPLLTKVEMYSHA